jgi:hypothetical protein
MEQHPIEQFRADLEHAIRCFYHSPPSNAPLDPTANRLMGIGYQQDQDGTWHEVVVEVPDIGDLTAQRDDLLPPPEP